MPSEPGRKLNSCDSLSCIPEKSIDVEEIFLGQDCLLLSYQTGYRPLFLKVRQLVGQTGSPKFTRKVELDQLGTQVWNLIDGKNDVLAIIRQFAEMHTLDPREAEISVTLFLRSLGKKGLIGMRSQVKP